MDIYIYRWIHIAWPDPLQSLSSAQHDINSCQLLRKYDLRKDLNNLTKPTKPPPIFLPDSCAWKHKSGHSISEISQGFGQTVCGVYWHPETVGGFTAPPPPSKMMYYGHCTIMYHHLWNPLKSHRPLKSLKAILNLAATSRRSVRDTCIWWVLMVLAPLV